MVWQNARVLGPLVDLQVGLRSEPLLTVGAGVVPLALVDHFHVALQLDPAGQQLTALGAGEHLLGD